MCSPFHTLIFNKKLILISAPPTGNGPRLPISGQNLWFHPDTRSEVLEDVRAAGDRTRGQSSVLVGQEGSGGASGDGGPHGP